MGRQVGEATLTSRWPPWRSARKRATAIAAPIVVVCCGGGGVILAAIVGGIGGWMSGMGGLVTLIAALGAALLFRDVRRHRAAKAGGAQDETCRLPKT